MKKYWTDKVAIVSALIGIILMILTIVWHANPVEGSVMPSYLTGNILGQAVICILIATSFPAQIATYPFYMFFQMFGSTPDLLLIGIMILLQGVIYFMIGKLISLCMKKFINPSNKSIQTDAADPRR